MADYNNLDTPSSAETPPPVPSGPGNGTFKVLIGILGVIFLVALALMATYLLVIRPRQSAQGPSSQASAEAKLMVQGTATALVATRDTLLLAITQTPGAVPAFATAAGLPALTETPGVPLVIPTQAENPTETLPAGGPTQPEIAGSPTEAAQAANPTQTEGQPINPTQAEAHPGSATQSGSPTQAIAQAGNPTQAVGQPVGSTQPGYPAANQTAVPGQATATRPAVAPTATITPVMIDARTATVAALLTQAAANIQPTEPVNAAGTPVNPAGTPVSVTATPGGAIAPTATALPKTGFAEDAGIPGLMGVAVALLIVIVVARGLRTRTS
jgi:hypothetical protein